LLRCGMTRKRLDIGGKRGGAERRPVSPLFSPKITGHSERSEKSVNM